ncbi:DEAD-domain-containing protein [Rhizophagus irregularis]|uniref:ATP-dependent RNA helicase DBP9 n=2 Tax=Rhizophagus irregularis TaxID=588596 RepID=A0A2I1EM00_9GLOM|nr:ATP-dependent RNA helicase dbp9 [Rhizophagus irregularis DAOM 181602=DAOM 197198]PKC04525.1 DEAD-domain-containing protein [Rhizophagus irregularis]PKY23158.1 DEAD-domain-containing protein [Rhizophagus irregularis]POG59277.1 ATP-dependent RNA helicase dbp9 [Rhizophagus irregularis DAOM 181602=DAOM 197198]|eukprot:XP_025166143.1 ATP-dependent RNA helicase dbp9 [Rhizophagus irregularis DAOM 181602=DAOM 197198]
MEFKDLDPRLSRALSKLNFHKPTLIQAKAIPLALAGKDILARARTGSGKTAAYCLPIVQKILVNKEALPESSSERITTRSIILVPTRELAVQITKFLSDLLIYCSKDVKVANLAGNIPVQLQKSILLEKPDIIVATPSRALAHLESQSLIVYNSLESLVIDEADLILSYGYEEDLQKILTYLPKIFQSLLMSATLTKDVENLKQLLLRNPAILTLHEEKEDNLLTQYAVRCSEMDKFLLIYVILKLRLIHGKCIIFVNDIDRCYRLKLFLEQFSIKSCVLNSELPLNSRYHIVQEFNKGVYDYIIATDEGDFKNSESNVDEEVQTSKKSTSENKSKKKLRLQKKDKEYGVSRGVDFINVAAVINFDFPTSAKSYTHRVGRTARANQRGMSLSFVVPKELVGQNKNVTCSTAKQDEKIYSRVEKKQSLTNSVIKPYSFEMKQLEGFRYRVEDALRAVTRIAVKEARLKDVKSEILNSEKLKAHFEDNPNDLKILRHDTTIHPARVQQHMKHIPSYLMPKIAPPSGVSSTQEDNEDLGSIPFRKNPPKRLSKNRHKKRKNDPLKTFRISDTFSTNKRQRKK